MRSFLEPEPGQEFKPHLVFVGIFTPMALASFPDLSPGAKLCYGALNYFAGRRGKSWPSVPTIAKMLGVVDRQVQRYLVELQDEHFIRRDFKKGGSTHYVFLWHPCFSGRKGMRKNLAITRPDYKR